MGQGDGVFPEVKIGDIKCDVSTYSYRKRAAGADNPTLKTDSIIIAEDEERAELMDEEMPATTVPVEVLDIVFEFLDGNGLLSCESVSYCWRLATDRTQLWKRACLSAFPHLGDPYFESPYSSCGAYEGDWRETFLDGNRANRSAVFDWNIEAVCPAEGNPQESERRYFPPFYLCGYHFSLLADPGGNPRAAAQAQASGVRRVEKGLSVYLTVAFLDETPDTPPWGGDGIDFSQPYPSPPHELGPGHPWGPDEDSEEDAACDHADVVVSTDDGHTSCEAPPISDQHASGSGEGASSAGGGSGSAEGARRKSRPVLAGSRRDLHGLRRRRRRFRLREGRVRGASHVDDDAALLRECCAAFSLTAVNKGGRKDVTWVSSMAGDRFHPFRSSWGVHCLLPTSTIQDPAEGFLKDSSLTVKLRVRLLFLIVHVYTTADLASHRGFGIVPVRAKEQMHHYYGNVDSKTSEDGGRPLGPLPCMTFEVLQCTTLHEIQEMIARALGLPSARDMRLWVITQPLTDGPLAPRQLLRDGEFPAQLIDDGQDSPSLYQLLRNDTLDDTCRVRLWVEQAADAGFWEADMARPGWNNVSEAEGGSVYPIPPGPATKTTFAGVRLKSTAERSPWLPPSSEKIWDELWATLLAPGHEAVAVAAAAAHPAVNVASVRGGAPAGDEGGASAASAPREEPLLVFLKTIGLRHEEETGGEGSGEVKPTYLTHAVLRKTSPLRALFELAAHKLQDGTAPEDLGAYVEELPCAWRPGAQARLVNRTCSRVFAAERTNGNGCTPSKPTGEPSIGSSTSNGAQRHRENTPRKRFLACPDTCPEVDSEDMCGPRSAWRDASVEGARYRSSSSTGSGTHTGDRDKEAVRVHGTVAATDRVESSLPSPPPARQGIVAKMPSRTAGCVAPCKSAVEGICGTEEGCIPITLEDAGVACGASLCFFRSIPGGRGEQLVKDVYAATADELVADMRALLRNEGPLGRVHLVKLPEVVEMCESLGYQGFRARIAHDQQRHINARETLEYVARGRHLAFICDSCGTQDFTGPRYHCLECPDYDLCRQCHQRINPVPRHRYVFTNGRWKREGGFEGHTGHHQLEEIWPVPTEGK